MGIQQNDEKYCDIKAVAFDLDGTLLDSNGDLSPAVITAVQLLRDRGILPIIATGRSFQAMSIYKKQLDISSPVICYNGAAIFNGHSGKILHSCLLDDEISQRIIDLGRAHGFHTQGFRNEELLFESHNEEVENYERHIGFHGSLVNFDTIEPLHMTKMMYVSQDTDGILELAKQLEAEFGRRLNQCFSLPTFYEMMDGQACKRQALEMVLDDAGIDMAHTMAFGDGHNDIPMLTSVKVGVVMNNASDEVKVSTNYRALDNDKDGVARYLDSYFHLNLFEDCLNAKSYAGQ